MKRVAVWGGSGAIGSHLCARLVADGHEVSVYDRQMPQFGWAPASRYHICDLRNTDTFLMHFVAGRYDEVFQLAAEMGGAGYVFSGSNDLDILTSSAQINLNMIRAWHNCTSKAPKIFFASSACVYESTGGACREDQGINPDSDYGFEKLFAEKLYDAAHRNNKLDIRIGRFHNVFMTHGTWRGGREKAPAALCRKIAELPPEGGEIEIWGSGQQTRSFLYVDEAVEAVIRLMRSDYCLPVNIGSSQSVTIDQLAQGVAHYANKPIAIKHIPGPLGVDGRNSDNTLIEYVLGWKPTQSLHVGIAQTYDWIKQEVDKLPDAI